MVIRCHVLVWYVWDIDGVYISHISDWYLSDTILWRIYCTFEYPKLYIMVTYLVDIDCRRMYQYYIWSISMDHKSHISDWCFILRTSGVIESIVWGTADGLVPWSDTDAMTPMVIDWTLNKWIFKIHWWLNDNLHEGPCFWWRIVVTYYLPPCCNVKCHCSALLLLLMHCFLFYFALFRNSWCFLLFYSFSTSLNSYACTCACTNSAYQ